MDPTTPNVKTTARLRLVEAGPDRVVVQVPEMNYQLHLKPAAPVSTEPGRRIKGTIRLPVWKVDFVSAGGGSFFEPVIGRPRRVHGRAMGALDGNKLVVDVVGVPVVADLPQRWRAEQIEPWTPVGLDVYDGATFEPAG